MKVSWQVTGIRRDAWATSQKVVVEEEKPPKERGYFLHPRLFDQPDEKGIGFVGHPEDRRRTQLRALAVEHLQALSRRRDLKPNASIAMPSPGPEGS